MAKKYLPQNKVGASRTKPMPERRSGANLPGPTGRQRPDTTSSPRGSGSRRAPVDRRRGPGGAPPGGGPAFTDKGGGDISGEAGGGIGGMG